MGSLTGVSKHYIKKIALAAAGYNFAALLIPRRNGRHLLFILLRFEEKVRELSSIKYKQRSVYGRQRSERGSPEWRFNDGRFLFWFIWREQESLAGLFRFLSRVVVLRGDAILRRVLVSDAYTGCIEVRDGV